MKEEGKGIGVYSGKVIRIVCPEGKIFEGFVSEYLYPDENENGMESIIIDTDDGRLIEFYPTDIKEIKVLSQ